MSSSAQPANMMLTDKNSYPLGMGMAAVTSASSMAHRILWSGGAAICVIVAAYNKTLKRGYMVHLAPTNAGKINEIKSDLWKYLGTNSTEIALKFASDCLNSSLLLPHLEGMANECGLKYELIKSKNLALYCGNGEFSIEFNFEKPLSSITDYDLTVDPSVTQLNIPQSSQSGKTRRLSGSGQSPKSWDFSK